LIIWVATIAVSTLASTVTVTAYAAILVLSFPSVAWCPSALFFFPLIFFPYLLITLAGSTLVSGRPELWLPIIFLKEFQTLSSLYVTSPSYHNYLVLTFTKLKYLNPQAAQPEQLPLELQGLVEFDDLFDF
jgi:hypothetical protein